MPKKKTFNFCLPSVAHEHLCLSSQTIDLAAPWGKDKQATHNKGSKSTDCKYSYPQATQSKMAGDKLRAFLFSQHVPDFCGGYS